MFLTNSFIIHQNIQNFPDMPGAFRMKMVLMEADKFLQWREDWDASFQEESGKYLSKQKNYINTCLAWNTFIKILKIFYLKTE